MNKSPELEPLSDEELKVLAARMSQGQLARTDQVMSLIAEVERSRQREKKYEEWLLIQLDGLHRSSGVEASRGAAHAFTRAIEVFQSLKAQPHQEGTEIGES